MTPTKPLIDQETRDKVNRIDQRVEEVVLPALLDLQKQMQNLSVVPMTEFVDYKTTMEKRVANLETEIQLARPAVKFFNLLNSRWTNLLIGGIIVAALLAVFSQINKIGIL